MSRGAHGSVTVTMVTCALSCLARASPCSRAFVASSEPSVAIRICLYIDGPRRHRLSDRLFPEPADARGRRIRVVAGDGERVARPQALSLLLRRYHARRLPWHSRGVDGTPLGRKLAVETSVKDALPSPRASHIASGRSLS